MTTASNQIDTKPFEKQVSFVSNLSTPPCGEHVMAGKGLLAAGKGLAAAKICAPTNGKFSDR